MKTVYPDEKNVVLNENSVERKPCINRESKSNELTIKLYSFHDTNMILLVAITSPSIYQKQNKEWNKNHSLILHKSPKSQYSVNSDVLVLWKYTWMMQISLLFFSGKYFHGVKYFPLKTKGCRIKTDMPSYPYNNIIHFIGGLFCVRLSYFSIVH